MSSHPTDLQRLLAEEPFVRSLAHSLLVDEADDVVQQAFLHALEHQPEALAQPRSWLSRVVRNLVTDQRRRRHRRDARERAAAVAERVPSAAELVAVEESRRALVAAVNRLPPPLRTVVLLRYYEGLPPRRIATTLCLPVATVWEQLRTALQHLRARLDAGHGRDRRAWLLPLVPVAVRPRTLPWRELLQSPAARILTGVLAMTTKTKIVATLAVALVLAGGWAVWPGGGGANPTPAGGPAGAALLSARGDAPRADPGTLTPPSPERVVVAAPPRVTPPTGSLQVVVRYHDAPRPAADLPVILNRPGEDFRVDVIRGRTDESGTAEFAAVPLGKWEVSTGRARGPKAVEIRAGEQTVCHLDLARGMSLSGIVVDATGAPVAGALIEVGEPRRRDPEIMATTGADGTFALRACNSVTLVGARAEGYGSSSLQLVDSSDGTPVHVRLELVAPGGAVEGFVLAADGTPVAGAVVRIGKGATDSLVGFSFSCPPLPAQVRTDAQGRFRAIGVPVGPQPVQARAVGFAPFAGGCDVAANVTVPLRVTLEAGATCEGTVVAEDGTPLADVTVLVGARGDFVQLFARTDTDGTFTLRDLPVGEVELTVADAERGKASAKITTTAGATAHCELRLSKGQELRGRVVDEADQPVAGMDVWVMAASTPELRTELAHTDRDGRFRVPSLPAGGRVSVRVQGKTFDPVRKSDIDPAAGEVLLRVQNPRRSARIHGVVLGVDGQPAANIGVEAHWHQTAGGMNVATRADGSFELGPLRTGPWQLRIIERGCAWYHSPTLTLTESATVDLGTIRLSRGGTVQVEVVGAAPEQLGFVIHDDGGDLVFGMVATNVPLRSLPLNPGGYQLRVKGKGFAAQSVPFAIRDGEETMLQVTVAPGTNQRFEFQVPPCDAAPAWFVFEVRRDGAVVLTAAASSQQAFAAEHWFAPGDYEVVLTDHDLHGSARFSVGREPGPPVVLPVQ